MLIEQAACPENRSIRKGLRVRIPPSSLLQLPRTECFLHFKQNRIINSRLLCDVPDQTLFIRGVLAFAVGDHKKVVNQFFGMNSLGAVEVLFFDQVCDVVVNLVVVIPALL